MGLEPTTGGDGVPDPDPPLRRHSGPVQAARELLAAVLLLAGIIIIHGLIHLLGAAKGFGWADVSALKGPISRGMAIVWVLAAALVVGAGVLLAADVHQWWMVAVVAAVVSQAAIFTSWSDAKAGTVANAILLLAAGYDALSGGLTTQQP